MALTQKAQLYYNLKKSEKKEEEGKSMSNVESTANPTNLGNTTSQFFNQLEETLKSWDKDGNKILDKNEVVQGVLKVIKLLALFVSVFGMVITGVTAAYGIVNDDFNWIIIIVGLALFVCVGIIYFVIKLQANANIEGMKRVNTEHRDGIKEINDDHKTHYDDLKERFIQYKKDMDEVVEKYQIKIETLNEKYYQVLVDAGTKGAVIALIQEQDKQEPKPKYQHINLTE